MVNYKARSEYFEEKKLGFVAHQTLVEKKVFDVILDSLFLAYGQSQNACT